MTLGIILEINRYHGLPGVDRMYLASPTEHSLYACDSSGPILDSNGDYQVMGTFGAEIANQLQE